MREPIPIRNAENVAAYRRDIEESCGRRLPDDQGNFTMVARFFGTDLDRLESLGLLNRGYCPFCGAEPIDRTYARGSNFSKVKVYLCKACWEQTNPSLHAKRALASVDLGNASHRRALPYLLMSVFLMSLARNFKWVVIAIVALVAWFLLK